jgi:hypothetical protein
MGMGAVREFHLHPSDMGYSARKGLEILQKSSPFQHRISADEISAAPASASDQSKLRWLNLTLDIQSRLEYEM